MLTPAALLLIGLGLTSLVFFVFWIFRLAFLANFLSRAVMAGFITGLGVEVFTNQVRKILAAPHVVDATSGWLLAAENLKETMATSVNRHAAQAFRQSPESATAEPDSSAVGKRDEGGTWR